MTREEFERIHGQFHGQTQTQPINVDDASDDELAAIFDHPGVHADVKAYADYIRYARQARLEGAVNIATRLERKAQRIYENDIPAHLRW